MEFTLKENETTLTVVLNGELDSISSPDVEEELFPLMEKNANEMLRSVLDSTGLASVFEFE